MSTLLVSSKGQIVLPAALRRRLGLSAGARLQVVDEEADGLRLRVVRTVAEAGDMSRLAGMIKAPSQGRPRSLDDFDPASTVARPSQLAPKPKPKPKPNPVGKPTAKRR